jgi:hypothetical protein
VTTNRRRMILRANGIWLLLASTAGLAADISGAFFARGPVGNVLRGAPEAAIGFMEAHGLAMILGVLFMVAAPRRSWHLAGAAIHILLGTCNLVFWQIFVTGDALAVGYFTTGLHAVFTALQLLAARQVAEPPASRIAAATASG